MDEFVSRLKETKLGHRHFYEVDLDGCHAVASDFHPEVCSQVIGHGNACHAYMDIEFAASINTGLDGGAMTRASSDRLVVSGYFSLTHSPVDYLIVRALHGHLLQVSGGAPKFISPPHFGTRPPIAYVKTSPMY